MTKANADFRNIGRVRSALTNAALYRVLSQIAGALTYVLLVRVMSEYDYGVYTLFYSIPAVMGVVLSLGIGNALSRFLPEYFANKNFALARHFVSWSLRLRLITSTVFLTLCYIFWDQIAPIFHIEDLKKYFLIFVAITLTHFQCSILTTTLAANLMQKWSSGLSTLFVLLKLVGYIIATYVGVTLERILIADLIAYLLWYAALRLAYHTKIPRQSGAPAARFSDKERRRVVRYAAFYNFNDVGVVALTSTADRLFIAGFMTPVSVGAYAFCTGLNVMLQKIMPISFFNSVIQPLIFTLDYNKQKARARGYFQFLIKLNYLVQFPIFVFFAAVPTQIINIIFAGKFIEYHYLLVAAFGFPVLYGFQGAVNIVAQLGERAGIILASKIFATYNVAAALILIPIYGVYGAIIATGTAQLFKNLFVWFFVREVATFRGTGLFFLNQTVMWVSCWALLTFFTRDMSDLPGLVTALVFVGLFAVIGVRLARFNNQEATLIRKISGARASQVLETIGAIDK